MYVDENGDLACCGPIFQTPKNARFANPTVNSWMYVLHAERVNASGLVATMSHVVVQLGRVIDRPIHSKYRSASHTRSYTFFLPCTYMYVRKYQCKSCLSRLELMRLGKRRGNFRATETGRSADITSFFLSFFFSKRIQEFLLYSRI